MKKKNQKVVKRIDLKPKGVYSPRVDFSQIKSRRLRLRLTQAEAARLAGWPASQHWSNVENSKEGENPRVLTLARVALVLKCTVDDLIGWK